MVPEQDDKPAEPDPVVPEQDDKPAEPNKPATPRTPAAQTKACIDTRKAAADAAKKADHRTAYTKSKSKKCWKGHERERTRIFVRAAFQQGKYAECVKAGQRSKDATVKRMVETCRVKQ